MPPFSFAAIAADCFRIRHAAITIISPPPVTPPLITPMIFFHAAAYATSCRVTPPLFAIFRAAMLYADCRHAIFFAAFAVADAAMLSFR